MRLHFRPQLLLVLAAAACSSSSGGGTGADASTPCNENPWECPSAQTCWPASASAYSCMNAGPGKLGASCQNTIASPTCGAGLACFQAIGASGGSCVAFCSTTDTKHACTGGLVCETVTLGGAGGPQFSVCVSPPGSDAGTDAPHGDTGADSPPRDAPASDAPAADAPAADSPAADSPPSG